MMLDVLTRKKHINETGWLAEIVSMREEDMPFHEIHSYIVMIEPGMSRANHYHLQKEEWLALGAGTLRVVLEMPGTGERVEKILAPDNKDYEIIYIPKNIAHSVMNIGTEKASVIVFAKHPELEGDTVPYDMDG